MTKLTNWNVAGKFTGRQAAALVAASASVGDADDGCGRPLTSPRRSSGRRPAQSAMQRSACRPLPFGPSVSRPLDH